MTDTDLDELLMAMCRRFVGYGSPGAAIWLIGLEEGGGSNWEDIQAHVRAWHARGRPMFASFRPDPVPEDHQWFGSRPNLQPYWSKLSRFVLAAEGRGTDTESVRAYQRDELAAPGSGAALLELLPLPSPSTTDWPYNGRTRLPWLASRDAYRDEVLPKRTRLLRQLIEHHEPRVVVFVGTTARASWAAVADATVPTAPEAPAHVVGKTLGLVVQHPAAFGTKNAYFESAGRSIRLAVTGPGERRPQQGRR